MNVKIEEMTPKQVINLAPGFVGGDGVALLYRRLVGYGLTIVNTTDVLNGKVGFAALITDERGKSSKLFATSHFCPTLERAMGWIEGKLDMRLQ